jgi:hypothetical protein
MKISEIKFNGKLFLLKDVHVEIPISDDTVYLEDENIGYVDYPNGLLMDIAWNVHSPHEVKTGFVLTVVDVNGKGWEYPLHIERVGCDEFKNALIALDNKLINNLPLK